MQEEQIAQQQFNTGLPYIPPTDTLVGHQAYIEFLYDSLNVRKVDSTFHLELKEIVLPDSNDTIQQVVFDKPSVFVPYKSKPVDIIPQIRNEVNMDWLTGLFLLCLFILAWIKYEGGKRVSQLFKAVIARHNVNQMLREGDIIHERITPALMFLYLVSFSTLIMILIQPLNIGFPWAESPFLLFSLLISAILILWILQISYISVSGKIFRTKNESFEYLVTNIIYNIVTGLLAFPFVFAGFYGDSKWCLIAALLIFAAGFLLKFVRSIFVGITAQSFPVVYLFLYLCTLEILPFLVIYKLLIS